MKKILLSQGYVATVDDDDYERVTQYIWSADVRPHTVYAINAAVGRLHTFIKPAPEGFDTAHEDGDGLNCQKYNLIVATRSQNLRHTLKPKGEIPYLGVARNKSGGKPFVARLRMPNGTRPSLGHHNTPEEAALAYDNAVRRVYGEGHPRNFK